MIINIIMRQLTLSKSLKALNILTQKSFISNILESTSLYIILCVEVTSSFSSERQSLKNNQLSLS
jgi:hypothetical protein